MVDKERAIENRNRVGWIVGTDEQTHGLAKG